MMFVRASLVFVLVSLAAVFCTVEAAQGPKITNKVFFDIKQGDNSLGRGACCLFGTGYIPQRLIMTICLVTFGLYGGVRSRCSIW